MALLLRLHAPALPHTFLLQLLTNWTTALQQQQQQQQLRSSTPAATAADAGNSRPASAATAAHPNAAAAAAFGSGSGSSRAVTPSLGGSSSIATEVATGQSAGQSGRSTWLLRLLYELAVAWPALLHPARTNSSSSGSSSRSNVGQQSRPASATAGSLWQQVYEAALEAVAAVAGQKAASGSGSSSTSQVATATAAAEPLLWLLAALLEQQLVSPQQVAAHRLALATALMPLLQFSGQTSCQAIDAACCCLTALLQSGSAVAPTTVGLSQQELHLRCQLLQPCLQHIAVAAAVAGPDGGLGSSRSNHQSMHLSRLLLPTVEVLLGCPSNPTSSSWSSSGSSNAIGVAAACMGQLQLEAQLLQLGGGAGGCSWFLPDPSTAVAEGEMQELCPATARLCWRRNKTELQLLLNQQQQQPEGQSGAAVAGLGGAGAAVAVAGGLGGDGSSMCWQLLQAAAQQMQEVREEEVHSWVFYPGHLDGST